MSIRIRRARTKAGLSQGRLGERVGVQRSAVAQWERITGTHPTVENLAAIAVVTGALLEWLATGRGGEEAALSSETPAVANDYAYTEEEAEMLRSLRGLSPSTRRLICRLLEVLVEEAYIDIRT